MSDEQRAEQEIYFGELRSRLKVGAECYGEKSFDKTDGRLLQEIQEEILDIAGWSYILWAKIERLKKAVPASERPQAS